MHHQGGPPRLSLTAFPSKSMINTSYATALGRTCKSLGPPRFGANMAYNNQNVCCRFIKVQ